MTADAGEWGREPSREGSGAVDGPKASPKGDRAAGGSRSQNRLVAVSSPATNTRVEFTYDGNGNTLTDGIRTYQWDAEDRLVKITQGTDEYEFIYDGLSRRVAEKVNGTITRRWIWDGTEIAEKRAADGTTVERRFFTQGEERVGGTDAGAYYYTRDHLGSIRELTDAIAAVRALYDYDPYGSREKLSGDLDCDFAFTGHFRHAPTGLHLALYRAYDSKTGRWLSRDPIERITGDMAELLPEGPNLYGYVGNNPVNLIDPYGQFAIVLAPAVPWLTSVAFSGLAAMGLWELGNALGNMVDDDDCPDYKPRTRDKKKNKMGGEDKDPFKGKGPKKGTNEYEKWRRQLEKDK